MYLQKIFLTKSKNKVILKSYLKSLFWSFTQKWRCNIDTFIPRGGSIVILLLFWRILTGKLGEGEDVNHNRKSRWIFSCNNVSTRDSSCGIQLGAKWQFCKKRKVYIIIKLIKWTIIIKLIFIFYTYTSNMFLFFLYNCLIYILVVI